MMRGTVGERFGIFLEPEVHLLGGGFPWDRSLTDTAAAGVGSRSEEG
jgi:hypothetical protein